MKNIILTYDCECIVTCGIKTKKGSIIMVIKNSVNKVFYFVVLIILLSIPQIRCKANGIIYNTSTSNDEKIIIDESTFPDENFRDYINEKIDTDKNGILDASEISVCKSIDVRDENINSIKGIEYFVNLTSLDCGDNNIQDMDITNNKQLLYLDCDRNDLKDLDLSNNTKLLELDCGYNYLKKLDVSANISIKIISCNDNNINELNVDNNEELVSLNCGSDLKNRNTISKLSLDNNPMLRMLNINNNNFTTIDLSNNTKLEKLLCSRNELSVLDLCNNKLIKNLWCNDNKISELKLDGCDNVTSLYCYNNQIRLLNLDNKEKLIYLNCMDNPFLCLDIPDSVNEFNYNLDNEQIYSTKAVELSSETGTMNVSSIPGFDKNKIISISGAKIIDDTIYFYSNDVEYEYKVGKNFTDIFKVKYLGKVVDEKEYPLVNTYYRTHIQTFGWEGKEGQVNTWKKNGEMSGTSGKAKRLEGIEIEVASAEAGKNVDLGIQYTTHCQSYGWLPWSAAGEMSGTSGEAKRIEAIMIQLTGADKDKYDVYYRVHAQSYGWLGWAKNGAPSGTAGYGKRLEGIQIVVVKKGESFDEKMGGITSKRTEAYVAKSGSSPVLGQAATDALKPIIKGADAPYVMYKTHVQTFGWQKWVYNGAMSGTSGKAKRLEGINIKLSNAPYEGDIVYTTHVQKYGWKDGKPNADKSTWKKNGEMSGTNGEAKRLEAICIDLTGEMAEHYDVYYRVHAQTFGWLGWAKNGEESGTAGYAKRLEGIQIVLVPKGGVAPANDYGGITSKDARAFIEKK